MFFASGRLTVTGHEIFVAIAGSSSKNDPNIYYVLSWQGHSNDLSDHIMLVGDFFEICDQNGLPWFNALLPSPTFMNVLFYQLCCKMA